MMAESQLRTGNMRRARVLDVGGSFSESVKGWGVWRRNRKRELGKLERKL